MGLRYAIYTVAAAGLIFSPPADAQYIPIGIAAAVVSPLVVIVLALLLGLLCRSWRTTGLHSGLVLLWVILVIAFSNLFTNDYLIWTPVVFYCVHTLTIIVLIVVNIVRRFRRPNSFARE